MKQKKSYVLCEGTGCPLKETCARYQEDLNRRTTNYFEPVPYQHNKPVPFKNGTNCFYYDDDI
jgi:hypothetical protein